MDYMIKSVVSEKDLDAVFAFAQRVFPNSTTIGYGEYAKEKWMARVAEHGDLMLYAETEKAVVAMTFGRVEANSRMIIGPVATEPRYRNRGIARSLMTELERRAAGKGIHSLVLGAAQSAEGFYLKCGYTPRLFIQTTPPHTLEELRALNTTCREVWSYDDGADIRLMLQTNGVDRELQNRYDAAFPGCGTQTVFTKNI